MLLVRARAYEFGVRGIDLEALSLDLAAVVSRKNGIVQGIIDGIYSWVTPNPKVTFIRGWAEFTSPVDIRIDEKHITAEKSIIATGSRTADVHIEGLTDVGYITNYEALELSMIPSSLIVIGAGYVGVEFAQMYARYGTRVTLLSRSERIMSQQEPELSEQLATILRAEGIDLHVSTTAVRAEKTNGKKTVIAQADGQEYLFTAEEILFAAGRVPRVDGLGLAKAGVEMGPHGILVDDSLQTTSKNIWSLGDVNGGAMFTHRATYDGPIVALNAIRDAGRTVDYRVVPRAVFTQPALASVGITELEATEIGHEVTTGVSYFKHSGRAKAIGETEGMVKLVADAQTGELLGGTSLALMPIF